MRLLKISIFVVIFLSLSGCATLHATAISPEGPGFWVGLWHGLIAPFAFVGRLFSDTVAVYETPNSGRWYDFGFLLGASAWAGGSAAGKVKNS